MVEFEVAREKWKEHSGNCGKLSNHANGRSKSVHGEVLGSSRR